MGAIKLLITKILQSSPGVIVFKCSIPALLAACRSGTALAEAEPLLSDLLGGHLWPVRPLLILWLEDVRIWVSISKSEFKKTNLGQFGCGSSPSYSLIGVYCNTHIHIYVYIYISSRCLAQGSYRWTYSPGAYATLPVLQTRSCQCQSTSLAARPVRWRRNASGIGSVVPQRMGLRSL